MLDRTIHLTPLELMLAVIIAKYIADGTHYVAAALYRRLRK